jgi:cell division protease FtsH
MDICINNILEVGVANMFNRLNKKIVIIIVSAIAALSIIACFTIFNSKKVTTPYNTFLSQISEGKVDKVYLGDKPDMKVKLKDGSIYYTDNPRSLEFKEALLKQNVKVEETGAASAGGSPFGAVLSLAILSTLAYFSITMAKKQKSGGMGGIMDITNLNKNTEENIKIGFSNVAGNDEAKESVKDIVDFLKDPDKYLRYGARMPRGVLFYGPPGTGKTLMAKAVAGEAGVPFYAMSGSDFVQVYVGVGAGRIRSLFKKAKDHGKCVIFIDEIDALGKKRDSGGVERGNDEREQTLNALLSEMSGFTENEGIIIIAATNRIDTLDEALLRPGRFDRQVEIGLPDIKGRYEILKIHAKDKPLSKEVDIKKIAEETVFFSGAMLESMVNEAAIYAAKRNAACIEKEDVDRAFYTILAGDEKKDRSSIKEIDKKITAYHEAGHALVAKIISPQNRISRVTIIPSTKGAGGYTMNIPPNRLYKTKKDMEKDIMISLGGRCAEEIVFGEENITTGASGDIERATEIVISMINRFGMNKNTGLLSYEVIYKNSFNNINDEIINESKKNIEALYKEVKEILVENKDKLTRLAFELLDKETLNECDLDSIVSA